MRQAKIKYAYILLGLHHTGHTCDKDIGEQCCSMCWEKIKNGFKVIRKTSEIGNKYFREARIYLWPDENGKTLTPFDIYPIGQVVNGQKFIIVQMQILEQGYVIGRDGQPTLIQYYDVIEEIDRRQPSMVSILKSHGAELIAQIHNHEGLEYFFYKIPLHMRKRLEKDIAKYAKIETRRFFNSNIMAERLRVAAWQTRNAVYNTIKFYEGPNISPLQSKFLPRLDFEIHGIILNSSLNHQVGNQFDEIKNQRIPGIIINGQTYSQIFGDEMLSFKIATLTKSQAFTLHFIMNERIRNNDSAKMAYAKYRKNFGKIRTNNIRKKVNKASGKISDPINKLLGCSEFTSMWISVQIISQMLANSDFKWTPETKNKKQNSI